MGIRLNGPSDVRAPNFNSSTIPVVVEVLEKIISLENLVMNLNLV